MLVSIMAMPFTDNGEIVGSIPTRAIRNIKTWRLWRSG